MNIKHAIASAAVLCLWLGWPPGAEKAAPAQEFTPQKQSLAIPITATGGRSVQCVVSCGPTVAISAVAFSPDGKTLAVGGYQEVLLWDLVGAKLAKRLGVGQLGGPVRALAFGNDGKTLAVGEGTPHVSGTVKLFDPESGEVIHSFDEPEDVVCSLAFSPDGKLLAAGGAYAPVHVWNVEGKKLATTLEGHADWVLDVSFSVDGKLLATGGADRALRVWKVEDWTQLIKVVENEAVHAAAFGADGKTLAVAVTGPTDRGIRLRRTDNDRYIRPFYMPGLSPLDVVWDTKKNRVYVPCTDSAIRVFDGNGRSLLTLSGHEDWVHCVALSPDGARLASGSADGTVRLWNTADGKLQATLVQLAPRTEDWLIVTAEGYLAASSAEAIRWKTTNVKTPAEEITGILQNAELVQKAMAGEKTDPPALE